MWRQLKTVLKVNDTNNIELTGVFYDMDKIPPIWAKKPYYVFFNTPVDEVVNHPVVNIPDAESEILYLRDRVKTLKKEIRIKDECLHEKNVALDAMHWVWCDGSCETGVHRFTEDDLTEEIVKKAERNTARLRRRLHNKK
jgi:hypothetical protein